MVKLRNILTVLFLAFGIAIVASPSAFATAANNTCYSNGLDSFWSTYNPADFPTYSDITHAPSFCLTDADTNDRLVFQANGDLTVWSSPNAGGSLLWQSHTGNIGATDLSLQSNGDIVIWRGSTLLWSSGSWRAYCMPSYYGVLPKWTIVVSYDKDCNGNNHTKNIAAW